MKKKIITVYLCSPYVPKKCFKDFLYHYKRYKSGIKHDLLICYKNLSECEILKFRKKLKGTKHIEFLDTEKKNDFDFGTLKRVAKRFKNYLIFFMNGHSYPVKDNWLKYFYKNHKTKTIIVSTASYESLSSNSRYRFKGDNYFKYFYKIIKYTFLFPLFPNPHFRTTNFLINANDFLSYHFPKKLKSKEEAWMVESGRKSIYNFFKKKKFNILVVNSDNKLFNEKNWFKSETYAYKEQSKKIMSDNHVRKYKKLNKEKKAKKSMTVWGRVG